MAGQGVVSEGEWEGVLGLGTNHLPLWPSMIGPFVLHEVGKPLIQPKIIPPLHGHQIAKPLNNKHLSCLLASHREEFEMGELLY